VRATEQRDSGRERGGGGGGHRPRDVPDSDRGPFVNIMGQFANNRDPNKGVIYKYQGAICKYSDRDS
jgi:hypothetical protein